MLSEQVWVWTDADGTWDRGTVKAFLQPVRPFPNVNPYARGDQSPAIAVVVMSDGSVREAILYDISYAEHRPPRR